MVCAGLAGGWSGVATKLASDDLSKHHLIVAALWGLSTAAASAVGVLSEMSALQSRPAIQVAPVVFVTQTIVPVALAPVLFGERFGATPLGGVPLGVSLAGADRRRGDARALAAAAGADGRRAREPRQRLGAQPRGSQPGDDALEPAHRRRGPVELDHEHVPRAHRALRQRAGGAQAQLALDRDRAVGAREHHLTDRQPAARTQEVEAVAQPQRARLRAQHAARAHPVEQRPARSTSGSSSSSQRAQRRRSVRARARRSRRRRTRGSPSPPARRRPTTIVAGGRMHDHADVRLRGRDVDEFVHVQQLVRHRRHLVGRHHPRADEQQQRQLGRERHQAQPPARDRAHAPRRLQHHVDGRRLVDDAGGAVRRRRLPARAGSARRRSSPATCVRSSSVSLARRSRSSAAIARVFRRA